MTPTEIIYHRRVRLLSLADELGNVAEACRQMGISRTRYYEWRRIVDAVRARGVDAQGAPRRRSCPNATPTHVVEELLTLAVIEPTIGCRQYADRLAERGYGVSKTTVQKLLVDHGLGRRAQRVARAAAITAATSGLSTEAARRRRAVRVLPLQPSSRLPGGPRQLLHRQPQRRRQGVSADRHRRRHPLGDHADRHRPAHRRPHDPLHRPRHAAASGASACRCAPCSPTTDPNTIAGGFRAHLAAKELEHVRIPPRSPNHNAVCERFQGTALQECWRPAFHRRRFSSASANSKPKPTPGSSATTTAAATTATTCAAAHPPKSSTTTAPVKHHDHRPQGPPPDAQPRSDQRPHDQRSNEPDGDSDPEPNRRHLTYADHVRGRYVGPMTSRRALCSNLVRFSAVVAVGHTVSDATVHARDARREC